MAKNYKDYKYFENRPDVVKIFDDLEAYLDWCRLEMAPYNEEDIQIEIFGSKSVRTVRMAVSLLFHQPFNKRI